MGKQARYLLHSCGEVDGLQYLLLFSGGNIDVAGGKIGKRCRGGNALNGGQQFRRGLRQELDRLLRLPLEMEETSLDFG